MDFKRFSSHRCSLNISKKSVNLSHRRNSLSKYSSRAESTLGRSSTMRPYNQTPIMIQPTSYESWRSHLFQVKSAGMKVRGLEKAPSDLISGHICLNAKKNEQEYDENDNVVVNLQPNNDVCNKQIGVYANEDKIEARNTSICEKLIPYISRALSKLKLRSPRFVKRRMAKYEDNVKTRLFEAIDETVQLPTSPDGSYYGYGHDDLYGSFHKAHLN